jgi:hypothetical protein
MHFEHQVDTVYRLRWVVDHLQACALSQCVMVCKQANRLMGGNDVGNDARSLTLSAPDSMPGEVSACGA